MSSKLDLRTSRLSPLKMTFLSTVSLNLSNSSSFALFSLASLLSCFLISFYLFASTLSDSAFLIESFLAWIACEWQFETPMIPSFTTELEPSMVAASSRKKSWILAMSHGRTCSSIALVCGVLSVPDLTSSVKLCSLSPARYPLAMNLAFNFWWADFLSYFLALFWTDLLSTSSLHLCSAASNL